jgi:cation transport regulator ChaC
MTDQINLRLRPFYRRLWNAYRVYRGTGLRPLKALRSAWFLSRAK